jgi:hypothetical protein
MPKTAGTLALPTTDPARCGRFSLCGRMGICQHRSAAVDVSFESLFSRLWFDWLSREPVLSGFRANRTNRTAGNRSSG